MKPENTKPSLESLLQSKKLDQPSEIFWNDEDEAYYMSDDEFGRLLHESWLDDMESYAEHAGHVRIEK